MKFMFILLCPAVSNAETVDIHRGTTLFRQACIGCHDAGGNVIQPVSIPLCMDDISLCPCRLKLICSLFLILFHYCNLQGSTLFTKDLQR